MVCVCVCVCVCVVGCRFPWTPPPPLLHTHTHTHTHRLIHTLTSSREIGGLCFLSGCPRQQTPGASRLVGIWSSHSTENPLPADEKENKTWGRHCSSSSAAVSHIFFAISLLRPRPLLSSSSLSSVLAVDSVNWLTQSPVHWLRSLIKGLLIGTLFNTGPCSESCPLIPSWQQPFPVCQSLNVINYVSRLRSYFPLLVWGQMAPEKSSEERAESQHTECDVCLLSNTSSCQLRRLISITCLFICYRYLSGLKPHKLSFVNCREIQETRVEAVKSPNTSLVLSCCICLFICKAPLHRVCSHNTVSWNT